MHNNQLFFTSLYFKILLEVISSYMVNVDVQLCILFISRIQASSFRTLSSKHNYCLKWIQFVLSLPLGYGGDQTVCNRLTLMSVKSEEIISLVNI